MEVVNISRIEVERSCRSRMVLCPWGTLLTEMETQLRACYMRGANKFVAEREEKQKQRTRSDVITLANHGEDVGIGLSNRSDKATANERHFMIST